MMMMAPTPKRALRKPAPSWPESAAPTPIMPISENNAPISRPIPAYKTAATFATETALTRVITIEALLGLLDGVTLALLRAPLSDPTRDGCAEHRQRDRAVTKDDVVEPLDVEAGAELPLRIGAEFLNLNLANHV